MPFASFPLSLLPGVLEGEPLTAREELRQALITNVRNKHLVIHYMFLF